MTKFCPDTNISRSALTRPVLELAGSAEAPLCLMLQEEKSTQAINQVWFLNDGVLQHGCRHQEEFTHLYSSDGKNIDQSLQFTAYSAISALELTFWYLSCASWKSREVHFKGTQISVGLQTRHVLRRSAEAGLLWTVGLGCFISSVFWMQSYHSSGSVLHCDTFSSSFSNGAKKTSHHASRCLPLLPLSFS